MTLKFNKILIVRLSAIGDVINTLPALMVVRHNFPKSYIAWVVEDKAKDLLVGLPYLNKVFIFDRRSPEKITRTCRLIRDIRKDEFDITLDFQGNLKSGLITYLSSASHRIGIKPAREGNALFTNYKIILPSQPINRVERNILILKELGLDISKFLSEKRSCPTLSFTKENESYIDSFLSIHNPENKPLVVVHPGTSDFGIFKRWAPEKYAQLLDRLIETFDIIAMISWAGREKALAESINSQMKHKAVILPQALSLNRLGLLLKRARLFIGSDSAPLHLANLVGTQVIGLYGPKDPRIYAPYSFSDNRKPIVISPDKNKVLCSPCQKRKCVKPICMSSITVDEVFQRVSEEIILKGN
jgi:ADP-heptose:LPS heptosyltransferase